MSPATYLTRRTRSVRQRSAVPSPGAPGGGGGGDDPLGPGRGDEAVEGRIGPFLDAEDEVRPALQVGDGHGEGAMAAAVVDGHVALGGALQVRAGGPAPVPVGGQVEVDRYPVARPAGGAGHAPGMAGAVGHAEAAGRGFPRRTRRRTARTRRPGSPVRTLWRYLLARTVWYRW